MNSILAVAFFVVPWPDSATATAHERASAAHIEQIALAETPQSIWRGDLLGDATHQQSTLSCPVTVGNFQRTRLLPFDNFGFDVGCNYDDQNGGRITIYLTRRTGLALKDDFATAQTAMKVSMPDIRPLTGDVPMPGDGLPFTAALYQRGDGARTGVWVADVSGWTLKFRATYAPRFERDVLDSMTKLVDRTQATAGAHLGACAAAPAVERTGTPITDSDKVMSLALMAGALDAVLDEKEPGVTIAEQWCAEEAAGDREVPFLFWRNIANSGNAGPMDRISAMTMSEPPILVSSANPTASLMLDEDDKANAPLVYQLTEERGDDTYVFAFYAGRPAVATLAPLTKNVMLGKKGALTSFNAKTKEITISTDTLDPGS